MYTSTKGETVKNEHVTPEYVPIARARVARFTRAIPRFASPESHALNATNRLSKFHHGTQLWASQNSFAGLFNFGFFPNMAIS
jgi:hypothetical protein